MKGTAVVMPASNEGSRIRQTVSAACPVIVHRA